jgi:hypothetical protein
MRLADATILVAGGLDSNGKPVGTLEWFNATATGALTLPGTTTPMTQGLVTGSAQSFIALEQGGALAVIAPPSGAPANFQNVWLIDSTGVPTAATPIPGSLTRPVLFGGAGGAPVLWTGDRWLVWEPWVGAFAALDVLDSTPARIVDATCSPDPGLAMWLDNRTEPDGGMALFPVGLRFDTRNAYSTLASPFTSAGSDTPALTPVDLAPDGLPGQGGFSYDPDDTLLTLSAGASVFVTDRTYADFAAIFASPTGQLPMVVLRDDAGNELDVGASACIPPCVACPLPSTPSPADSLMVARQGGTVTFTVTGGPNGTCPAAPFLTQARISLGLRGAQGSNPSTVGEIDVTRLGTP